MKAICFSVLLLTICSVALSDEVRELRVQFQPGTDSAEIADKISGGESVLYKLNAKDGQFLSVSLRPDNLSANYNIYIPGRGPGDEALFVSAVGGHEYVGQLYKTGDHTVSVFLNRNAAREGQVANYDIVFKITSMPPGAASPSPAPSPVVSSDAMTASYGDIQFSVTSRDNGNGNTFTIRPSGLSVSNDPFNVDVQGRVVDVIADDMDGDNSPEVAVITELAPGERRCAHVFTTFAGKSFGMVNFPEVGDPDALSGYDGGDDFAFVENTFIRRFPIHDKSSPTRKTRQLQFKLKPGEATKQLVLDRIVEY